MHKINVRDCYYILLNIRIGPLMRSVLENNVDGNLSSLYFMRSEEMKMFNIPDCRVSRCGYTGEDGVEVFVFVQV